MLCVLLFVCLRACVCFRCVCLRIRLFVCVIIRLIVCVIDCVIARVLARVDRLWVYACVVDCVCLFV